MRKVTFGGANSFDNYFARKDHSVDWLMWSDEVTVIMKEFWKTIDTVVMGRKTYEAGLQMGWRSDAFPGVKHYIFSRTMKNKAGSGVEIISEDAADFVRKLKSQKGKDICVMGGGLLANSLFEANLIDEIGFNIHPVLLGSGIPVFHEMTHQINLDLIKCQVLKNGCVMLTYRVKHPGKKKLSAKKSQKGKAKKQNRDR
jgi:dihydrofolate reductase